TRRPQRFDTTRLSWIRAVTDGVVAVDAARVRAHRLRADHAGRLLLPLLRPGGRRGRGARRARGRRTGLAPVVALLSDLDRVSRPAARPAAAPHGQGR